MCLQQFEIRFHTLLNQKLGVKSYSTHVVPEKDLYIILWKAYFSLTAEQQTNFFLVFGADDDFLNIDCFLNSVLKPQVFSIKTS